MIYFIHDPISRRVKIGVAGDPYGRLRALQTGNPNRLTMLGIIPGGLSEESALHRRFADYRGSIGEWFRGEEGLLIEVQNILAESKNIAFGPKVMDQLYDLDWCRQASSCSSGLALIQRLVRARLATPVGLPCGVAFSDDFALTGMDRRAYRIVGLCPELRPFDSWRLDSSIQYHPSIGAACDAFEKAFNAGSELRKEVEQCAP
jgi:hypothetical protein